MKLDMTSEEFVELFHAPNEKIRDLKETLQNYRDAENRSFERFYAEQNLRISVESELRELKEKMNPQLAGPSMVERQVRGIITAVAADHKIAGIKLVREILGLGLKDAKDLYEALAKARSLATPYVHEVVWQAETQRHTDDNEANK